jgi:hypothetical protein
MDIERLINWKVAFKQRKSSITAIKTLAVPVPGVAGKQTNYSVKLGTAF